MEPTLKWFQKRFGLGKEGVSHVFQKQPSLFGCNVTTNLEPTTQFYENCVGSKTAGSLLLSDPRLFSASLENRLKPRREEAVELGLSIDSGMLQRMAKYTEDKWANSLDYQTRQKLKDVDQLW